MRVFAAFCPANGPVHGLFKLIGRAAEGRALVEAHSDIAAEAILNLGCLFGVEINLCPIDVAGEFDTVVVDFRELA